MTMMQEKLNHYDHFEVLERFNIRKNQYCDSLQDWLNCTGSLSSTEDEILHYVRTELEVFGRDWNEEELKINFIAFVFFVAKINVKDKIQVFFERSMSGEVEGIPISVKVDGMIATPTVANRPKNPYFFLQEFKRSLGDDHDRCGGPSRRPNVSRYDFSRFGGLPRTKSRR
jgi:hypothetical protein